MTGRFDQQPKLAREIRTSDLASLVHLDASNRGIRSISGLEHAVNLRSLILANNSITDLSPISSRIGTTENGGKDAGARLGLNQIQQLNLDNNLILDLSPISHHSSLESLSADYNALSSLTGFNVSENAKHISLDGSSVLTTEQIIQFNPILLGTSLASGQFRVQSDGKILYATYRNSSPFNWIVARFLPNGSLDSSFGNSGVFEGLATDVNKPISGLGGMDLQSDGKILLTGGVGDGSARDMHIKRLNSNGTLDISFNGSGSLTQAASTVDSDFGVRTLERPDGTLYVIGVADHNGNEPSNYTPTIWKISSGGTFINRSSNYGIYPSASVSNAVLDGSGHIVIVGAAFDTVNTPTAEQTSRFIWRINESDYSFDTTFGTVGRIEYREPLVEDIAMDVVVDDSGNVVVSNYYRPLNGSSSGILVERYSADGIPDSSFGEAGKTFLPNIVPNGYAARHLAIDRFGNLSVSGISPNSTQASIAYLTPTGQPDSRVGESGVVSLPIGKQSGNVKMGLIPLRDDRVLVTFAGNAIAQLQGAVIKLQPNQIDDLDWLSNGSHLETLSASGQKISDLAPIQELSQLRSLNLRGNQISDLQGTTKSRFADDNLNGLGGGQTGVGPSEFLHSTFTTTGNWQNNIDPNSLGFHGDIRTAQPTSGANPTATANWTFNSVSPGQYEVWTTWIPGETQASNAPYSIAWTTVENDQISMRTETGIIANQRFSPGTVAGTISVVHNGRVWQKLKNSIDVGVTSNVSLGSVTLTLSNQADGLVVADGVMLRRATPVLAQLRFADFRDNPLNRDSIDSHLVDLAQTVTQIPSPDQVAVGAIDTADLLSSTSIAPTLPLMTHTSVRNSSATVLDLDPRIYDGQNFLRLNGWNTIPIDAIKMAMENSWSRAICSIHPVAALKRLLLDCLLMGSST